MNKETYRNIVKTVHRQDNFSFAKNTTYGCGGNAATSYFPRNTCQAAAVYTYLKDGGINCVTLGNGSNVLASDSGFNGAVICTKQLSGAELTDRNTLFCLAGTSVGQLLSFCVKNGLTGLEYLAGIPATCGGLAFMNAGAGGRYVNENIVNVRLFDGKIRNLSNKCCNFGYKYSIMRDINDLILGVEFTVGSENGEKVRDNIQKYLDRRKLHPKGRSCGCVFKNIGNVSAGKIIDEAGLKGLSVGGAKVSEDHANFIINTGNSSRDVYELIKEVKTRVLARTGISLEEEVVYIGDF